MKALSKPLSSPGRTEKFPPPLMMRFLRSNVGSRSRGRSRSSPMFYLRSRKSLPGAIEATQEPSSPKVTCIGQVRVRRSAKSKGRRTAAKRRRCWWLKKALFCGKFSLRFRGRPFRRIFRKWGSFFRSGYCKKVDVADDSEAHSNARTGKNEKNENRASSSSNNSESDDNSNKYENLGAGSREIKRGFLESSSSSPPRNALILTRCRSAPYRSSSLGGRFWAQNEEDNETENEKKSENLANPISENEPRISKEMENSEKSVEDMKANAGGAVNPLLLTRCKSEPARTGERLILNQESRLILMQRRLDDVDNPCSQ